MEGLTKNAKLDVSGCDGTKQIRKVEKDLTFLFDLRFTWDSAEAPDLRYLSMMRGGGCVV